MHIGLVPAYAAGFEEILQQAQIAEAAGVDFLWLPEQLSGKGLGFDATLLASALATRTRAISLLVTAAPARHEPYNLARRIASLDWIADGRIGWMIDAGGDVEREREYVELVGNLWDSWDDDAFIYDKAAGRFFTPDKMHVLNHAGTHFSVRGPLNVNRPPQGRPVIAAMSGAALAKTADLVLLAEGASRPVETNARVLALRDQLATTSMAELEIDARDGGLDGFILQPKTIDDLRAFAEGLGAPRERVAGATFRQRLGLARPSLPSSPEVAV